MNDTQLWREFLDFRIAECLGLWADAVVEFPFGSLVVLDPTDDVSLLMRADLTNCEFWDVVDACDKIGKQLGRYVGFMISSGAWAGDVEGFCRYARMRGYSPQTELAWFIHENISMPETFADTDCTVSVAQPGEAHIVVDLFRSTLGLSEALGKRLRRKLERPQGSVRTACLLARDPGGRPVAVSGVSWRGEWGHAHSVGVIPEYRRKGLSLHMAKTRMALFKEHGVTKYVAWVNSQNAPSLASVKRHGYREFQRTMTWR